MMLWLRSRIAPLFGAAFCLRTGEAMQAAGAIHRGAALIARAARRGHTGAALAVAELYVSGRGLPPSQREAGRWFERAAVAGDAIAQAAYAAFLWRMPPLDQEADPLSQASAHTAPEARDGARALHWAERAAAAGAPEAQALLGQILCFGPESMRDEARGDAFYRQAAAAGRADAFLGLALLLHRRGGTDAVQHTEKKRLFRRAAEGGATYAFHALGILAEQEQAWPEAATAYGEAARRGLPGAQIRFGALLLAGHGVARDAMAGETWLRRAALAGEAEAALCLGDLYRTPMDGLPPNATEAAAWYARAAEAGHALAQYRYGRMLFDNARTSEASAEAQLWIGRAAEAGLAAAQAILGEMLLHGRAGSPDIAAAHATFERAAAQGHLGAIFALGVLHAGIEGVPRDLALAEGRLTEAARRGHLPAQTELARLRALGVLPSPDANRP